MHIIKKLINFILISWRSMYISFKILLIVLLLCFFTIGSSIFNPFLDATGNLVTIRTIFSSIIGYVLESSTKQVIACKKNAVVLRNIIVGFIAIGITIIIIFSYFYAVDVNNPSLLLFKNILFSCIGFLISASEKCSTE